MNRRQLLGGIAGTLLSPSIARAQGDSATPAATPQHSGRPRPHVLGDGIELVDYRIYPSNDVRRVIGEIWNTRDDMVDSPVVSMTFPGVEDLGGFAYASPFMPILRPGESTMIFGVLPDEIDSQERLENGTFDLCGPVATDKWSDRYAGLMLSVNQNEASFTETAVNIVGEIRNEGEARAAFTCVRGLVRDHNGRYAGCTMDSNTGHILPRSTKTYSLWAATTLPILADPYVLIRPGTSYSVDVIPGLIGPLTAPGCSAGYPWK